MSTEQGQQIQPSITTFRHRIDMFINSFPYLLGSREVSLAHTHCQRAFMWLGKALGATGSETPYKESNNPQSKTIEPTADHNSETSLMNAWWDTLEPTQTARVKSFRDFIARHVTEFNEWRKSSESAGEEYELYLTQHKLAIQETSMWLGWELARIKKSQDNPNQASIPKDLLPTSL